MRARPSTTARGYGGAWQRERRAVLAVQPVCQRCGTAGSPRNPLSVDHVRPLVRGGLGLAGNLQTLCRRCNSAKGGR